MKTTAPISLCIVLLFSVLFATNSTSVVKANPIGEMEYATLPLIIINSPLDNSTFSIDKISLNITVARPHGWLIQGGEARQMLKSISYELDGKVNGPIVADSYLESSFNYSTDLANLTVGRHSLKVFAEANGWFIELHDLWRREETITASSDIIYFTVEKNVPEVIVAPIENSSTPDVLLNVNVNCTASRIVYSLDGRENQSFSGNTTLTGLSNGLHNVTVYAWNLDGNVGVSDTLFFDVEVPEPFPTTQIIAVFLIVSAVIVCIALFIFVRKRLHKKELAN
jgi:hypothetical protein